MHKQKITEFTWFLKKISCISNEEYQERIWVKHEDPRIVDSYDDTTMYFLEDAGAILRDPSDVEITEKQYDLLKSLYERVEEYDMREERPDMDAEIIKDPDWIKIREFAKIVYRELTVEH